MFQFYLLQIRTVGTVSTVVSELIDFISRRKTRAEKLTKTRNVCFDRHINSFTNLYVINNIYRKNINLAASLDIFEQQKNIKQFIMYK